MKKLLDLITAEVAKGFEQCGYDRMYARVSISNRPDLCEYQCNGAMALAKIEKKSPLLIAGDVVKMLSGCQAFSQIKAAAPGFINLTLAENFLSDYINDMNSDDRFGCDEDENAAKIVIDYGGANVAKPLHAGHLRPAIIGESLKRIFRYMGNSVIGDAHLGDWGLQMGLIITEMRTRQPELIYFKEGDHSPYPETPPFTIGELEEIYPCANAKSKEDPEYKNEAKKATVLLQKGNPGYKALWKHIIAVSLPDIKKNYDRLNVSFDLWNKESDAMPYIPALMKLLEKSGLLYESDGALVIDVKEESDSKEIPPCMIIKSDGGILYNTTDLGTLLERKENYHPGRIIYVVDKRQGLYFEQVFRCAKKTKLIDEQTELIFLGFGTMNGKDGKPFKTRDGGIMRLEQLMDDIHDAVLDKMKASQSDNVTDKENTSQKIALAALKYGDLSNQAAKDYIFDIERFTSFDGDTGPYILYTIVRIKSILQKYNELKGKEAPEADFICAASTESEKNLHKAIALYNQAVWEAYEELAPHKLCQYIFELSNTFNRFYHETKIIAETDDKKQAGYITLITLTMKLLTRCIDMLGFEAPERM